MRRVVSLGVALAAALIAAGSVCGSAAKQPWSRWASQHGVKDARVLAAMDKVRRADFLPAAVRGREYEDVPLDIGYEQTTSQPTLIALMVEAMALEPGCHVLEVGTGSGYQTAILAELCDQVASIDIVEPLAVRAGKRLVELGYKNTAVKAGDGYLGWPAKAPFDAIVVCAAAPQIPRPLVEQLKPGGKLVIPVGEREGQHLQVITKAGDGGTMTEKTIPVRFVPLTGEHADKDRRR